jgi:hypothetical protein
MKRFFIILLLLCLLLPISTYAQTQNSHDAGLTTRTVNSPDDNTKAKNPAGTEATGPQTLEDPLGNKGSLAAAVNNLIKGVMGIVGVLAIVAFVWGGVEWMISGGNPEKIKKGKTMMVWAVWGLVVIFGAYAILDVIFRALGA